MASIYDLKPAFQGLLRPTTAWLAAKRVTANQITLTALGLSFAGGAAIVLWHQRQWPLLLVPVILFVRMALNAIDGMLAREHDMRSDLGAALNELGDVLSDVGLYLPFALVVGLSAHALVIIVCLSIISEMAGVVAVQIGAGRRYDGPMGKSDRAFVFSILGLLLGCGFAPQPWIDVSLYATAGLLVLTICNRVRAALQEVR